MKTTVELPDAIYRQAKAEAALRGRKLKDLIEGAPPCPRRPGPGGKSPRSGRADAARTRRGRVRHSRSRLESRAPQGLRARCEPSLIPGRWSLSSIGRNDI